jgi:hypothetical protein
MASLGGGQGDSDQTIKALASHRKDTREASTRNSVGLRDT